MAIVAMIILGVLIFLLTSRQSVFAKNATLYTYLADSVALAQGAPVRLNGILIGNVARVELSGLPDVNARVRVVMSVQQDKLKNIPIDSVASVTAENVLGTKYINISMGQAQRTIQPGGTIRAENVQEFEDLVKRGFSVIDSLQAILGRVDKIVAMVEAGHGTIGKFLTDEEFYNRLVATVAEMQKVATAVGQGKGTLGRLLYDERLYDQVLASTQRLDSIIADIQQGQGTAGKLLRDPALYNDARDTIAQLRLVLQDVNAGKGTVGKLLKDDTAYRQIEALLGKINGTIDRVNSGQGTLGQLIVNPQLYDNMTGATSEIRQLIKDIRANPKKYLRLKLSIF